MKKILFVVFILFYGCSTKQPIKSEAKLIIFKTKKFKFADFGFINRYDDYINLQILNAGIVVLDLDIYKDKVCKKDSILYCQDAILFYKENFGFAYKSNFLYNIFLKKHYKLKDKKNKIFIKF